MAERFPEGVQWYTFAKLELDIGFPEGEVKCKWCPFLKTELSGLRHRCSLKERIVYAPEHKADFCPLKMEEKINGADS